jgi:hypothetical protein
MWSCLCPTPEQTAYCKALFCSTQFGQLFNNSLAPASALTGGVIPQCCPNDANNNPNPADLLKDPDGALGAAARIKQDEAEAKARRAAVRYLSTAECSRWPEAKAALINALRADHNECVRMEAAYALGRGCCCNRDTIVALAMTVSGSNEDGNPRECSERVRLAALGSLEHCLACFVEVVPVPVEVKKPEGPPKPPEGGKPEPYPKPDSGTSTTTSASSAKLTFYERVHTLPADHVVRFAKAVLQRAQANTYSASLPTGSHSIYEVVRTAFAPEGAAAEPVDSQAASSSPPVETAPPPPLRPVPVTSTAPVTPAPAAEPPARVQPVRGEPPTSPALPATGVWKAPEPAAFRTTQDPMPWQGRPSAPPMPYPYTPGATPVLPRPSSAAVSAPREYPYPVGTSAPLGASPRSPQATLPAGTDSGMYPYTPGAAAPSKEQTVPAGNISQGYPYAPTEEQPSNRSSEPPAPTPPSNVTQGYPYAPGEDHSAPHAPGEEQPSQRSSEPPTPPPPSNMTQGYPYAPGEDHSTPPSTEPTPPIQPAAATAPAADVTPMEPSVVVQSVAAEGPTAHQLVVLLEQSKYPDVRRYAIKRLVSSREPVTRQVAEALVKSAAKDEVAGIRIACVQALMQLGVNDPLIGELAEYLQKDRDGQIRDVGEQLGQWYQSRTGSRARTD